MRLLVINDHGIQGGGTENRISTLIDFFIKNKIFQEIHVIQLGNSRDKPFKDKRVTVHSCPAGHFASYLFTRKVIKKYKIDFVQAHNMMALTPMPLLAAKSLKKPAVWYAHDYWAVCAFRNFINPYNAMEDELCGGVMGKKCIKCRSGLKSSLKFWLWKRVINHADLAIATGRKMISIYSSNGILNGRWKVVIPWIDPSMLKKAGAVSNNRSKRGNNILFVGSLIDFKGAWVAAKALKYVLREMPDAHLVFIGGDQENNLPYRGRIEKISRKDNTSKNISFAGRKNRKQIKKELEKAGVYVCPTVCMESFGLNWAEAMASGCPVVASRIGTIPEHITEKNQNGILFEPRNHYELAEKIITFFKNKQFSETIGKNAELYASLNFNIEKSGKEIVKLYRLI